MSWEDTPNFIPCVKYLCKNYKMDHALALYMLAFVDVPKDEINDSFLDIPEGVPMELFDRSQEMLVYHMSQLLGPHHEIICKYRNKWDETIGEISKEYADKIYSLIELFKHNNININYFHVDNLDWDDEDSREKQYEYTVEKINSIVMVDL